MIEEQMPQEGTDQEKQQEMAEMATTFNQKLSDLILEHRDSLPLAYMAKNLLSTSVDLIMNQAAIQTQFIVQEMLAPLFQPQEKDPSRIIIP